MSNESIMFIIINIVLAIVCFYAAYDVAINNNFTAYIMKKTDNWSIKRNKKVLGEKLGLIYVIWGMCFFVGPIYIIKTGPIVGFYVIFLLIVSIISIVLSVRILKKYLY